MANEFIARNGITSLGDIVVSGSLTTTGAITISGSIASASFATNAATASSADNLLVRSTLTAQTLVVQTITSSVDFVTGSTQFGSLLSNNHVFSGSVTMNPGGLFVSSSGNVGIGNINPLSKLDVTVLASGARRLLVNYDDSIVTVKSANDSAGGETLRLIGDSIIFNTGSAGSGGEVMRLTNTGRVGIGTASPSYKFHVYAPSSASYFDGGTTDTSFYISHGSYLPGQTIGGIRTNSGSPVLNAKSGGTLYFNRDINSANVEFQYNTGSATSLFISSSGLIGIGTGAPNQTLHVHGSGAGINITGGNNRIYFSGSRAMEGDGTQLQIGEGHAKTFFQTSTAGTVMTVTGSRVGIGTSSPSSRLGVKVAGADGLVLEQDSNDATNSSRLFLTGSVQTYGMFNNAGDWRFTYGAQPANTSGTSLARFTNTGKYFRMESGTGGIQFQGNTASTNALNAYEEGSWTPTFDGNGATPSYSHQFGRYTRIGRVVHLVGKIGLTNGTGGGTITITGIPFTAADASDSGQRCSARPEGDWSGFGSVAAFNNIMFRISSNSLVAVTCNSGGSSSYIGYNSFSSTLYFNFNVTYYV